jgi:hypothetical protein
VEHLLEVVSVGRRPAAGGHQHVDQRIAATGIVAADQDSVGAGADAEMGEAALSAWTMRALRLRSSEGIAAAGNWSMVMTGLLPETGFARGLEHGEIGDGRRHFSQPHCERP